MRLVKKKHAKYFEKNVNGKVQCFFPVRVFFHV